MPRYIQLLLLILSMGVSGTGGAFAAADTSAADAEQSSAGPEIIPVTEIPFRAEIDDRFALDVIQRAQEADPANALETSLSELSRSVLEQSTTFKSDELRLLSVIRLESFERHWRFFGHQLELWRAELARINDRYLEDAATLGKRKASWRATLASAEEQGIPRALVDLITALQADLAKAEQALSVPLNHQIQLNQRASALEADIQNGQRVVAEAIIYSDSRLTKIDAPPLWTALGHSNDSDVDSVAKVCKWKGCF